MQKKLIFLILVLGGVLPALRAQSSVSEVRVFTSAPGVYFRVDDQLMLTSAVFLWPAGSKHTITFLIGDQTALGTQFAYNGWVTNLSPSAAPSSAQPITASAGLQWVRLDFDVSYLLTITMANAPSTGQVQVIQGGTCGGVYVTGFACWIPQSGAVDIRASPNAGAIFTRWISGTGVPGEPTSFTLTFPMTRPVSLLPEFMPAAAATTTVNILTDPQELTVIVDGVRLEKPPVPVTFEWGWGTVHHIAVDANQMSRGIAYVFQSWSDGGDFSHDVTISSPSKPITFTANFVPAHTVRFSTTPPNLKLTVDGRQDWLNYAFAWLPGSIHRISAPATQTDAQGRRYRFDSWSNRQPASFDYTAGPAGTPAEEPLIVATYQLLGQATITTSPANLPVEVDGVSCATPCVVQRDAGQSFHVTAALILNNSQSSRLVFRGWTDISSESREIQLLGDPKTYLANYATQSRLSVAAMPPDGAGILLNPASDHGFFDTGSVVSVTATPALGFRIHTWSGDLSGTGTNMPVLVDGPKDILLLLDRVPAIGPSGIRSAAVGASADDVAPGSLISIFGAHLAPDVAIGPSNPLAQILQGVIVRVDSTLLPLVFVSPAQINAQLPAGTPLGIRRLTISSEGNPEISTTVRVVRNSPGLFSSGTSDEPIGFFVRVGGEPVTTDHPARPGDTIAVFGTGLGPYSSEPPDAFVLDESSGYIIVDKVQVILGDSTVDASFAGRSSAGAGVDAVRFRVPLDIPDSKTLPVKISVNDRESNTVLLPVAK